ncbi:MAG: winged helix-turn-helix domain-containing protein [Acidobacteriota bacterium]|nr:winged helix-turn-helix domain-containing protein [Acidobacteriota bacterium]
MGRAAVADAHDIDASPESVGSGAEPPRRGIGLVRDRLTSRLLDPAHFRVGWIVAPAGSGKTRLLAHVADRYRGPLAWCDPPDPLPRSEGALAAWIWEGLVAGGVEGAGSEPPGGLSELLRLPIETPRPLIVVLDDVHLLDGSEAEAALDSLVARLPGGWRLVMASRINLAIDLSRLRVSGEVVDIGPDELRFRTWEVEELFRDVYREPLLPEDVAALTRRTSGWAAYLQMFFLATSRRPQAERRMVLGTLAHRTRLVSEYLGRHVLSGLDPALQDFLVRTSALRRPSSRLADEYLGWEDGSAAILAELERRQLFTERLADDSYRYHAVMVTHLDSKLVETLGLERARAEHRRAGTLLERERLMEEALAAYARAEDWEGMARVVGHLGADHTNLDDSWAEALPPGVLESDPLLLMAQARSALSRGALAESAAVLRRAEAAAVSATVADRCRSQREQILAWVEPDRPAGGDWSGVLRRATQHHPLQGCQTAAVLPGPTGRFAEGCAALIAGEVQVAARTLRSVSADPDAPSAVAVAASFVQAACALLRGRPVTADLIARLREDTEVAGMRWLGRIARAGLAGTDPEADETVDDLIGACDRQGDRWGSAVISAIDGFRHLCRRDPGAEAILARAADAAAVLGAGALEASLAGYAAVAAVASGRTLAAGAHIGRARALGAALEVPWASALAALASGDARLEAEARAYFERVGAWEWHQALVAVATPPADWSAAPPKPPPTVAGATPESGDGPAGGDGPAVPVAPDGVTRLHCMGEYLLEIDGRRVDDGAAKPMERALLYMLSMRAGTGVHRETLVAALWPDADAEVGLHRLQVAVSSLRRLVAVTGADANEIILRRGHTYRLALPAGSRVDLAEFEQAITRAEAARAVGDSVTERAALEQALAAYGGALLPGAGAAEWAVEARRWLTAAYSDATARLSALLIGAGEPRPAVRVARAGLGVDRYRDDLWKLLIEAAEMGGSQAEAEQARRDYDAVLNDLGV